jgi:alpha-galactosidase
MPVEGDTGTCASNMFSRKIGNTLYLAVFNYDTNPQTFVIDAKRIGLSQDHLYKGSELLQGGQVSLNNSTKINMPGADAMLFKFKVQ